jgi:hypothetical protein
MKAELKRIVEHTVGAARGLGLGSQKKAGSALLLTAGLYYINAAATSALVPKGTTSRYRASHLRQTSPPLI